MDTKDKNELNNYHPMKFVDQIERNRHTLLFYDNQKYAYWIIARYFLNGFAKGESCILYTVDRAEIMEKHLSASGIDVSLFKSKNMLRIYEIVGSDDDIKHDIPHTLDRMREESIKSMNPPYRFVGGTITEIGTIDGMRFIISLEKTGHRHFDEYNYSQICVYDISKMEPTRKHEWISSLLRNHHHVIYASEPDKAVAFETDLLELELDADSNNDK
jgi:hypothetical protein